MNLHADCGLFASINEWLNGDLVQRLEFSLKKAKEHEIIRISDLPATGPGLGCYERNKMGFFDFEYVMKEMGEESMHYLFFDRHFNLLYRIT
jgi:hypothetical protein